MLNRKGKTMYKVLNAETPIVRKDGTMDIPVWIDNDMKGYSQVVIFRFNPRLKASLKRANATSSDVKIADIISERGSERVFSVKAGAVVSLPKNVEIDRKYVYEKNEDGTYTHIRYKIYPLEQ